MELKKIIKSTSFLVSSKLVQFLTGLLKSKIGAVFLGTGGTGIYNQVSYITTMISQITLLSMNDGLVKQLAQSKDKPDFKTILKGLFKAYILLIVVALAITFTLCLIFSKKLTVFFLGDARYTTYYLIGVAGVPILIMNSLSFAVLKSYKATREISRANIFSSVFSVLFFVPLVYFFKITGAIVSVTGNFLMILYINNYQARKLIYKEAGISFKDLFRSRIEKKYSRELLYFAFFGATTGLIYIGAESLCRSVVVNKLGIERLGVYSPVIAWGTLLTGFIIPAIQVYLFPRFSECKSNEEISGIINDYLYLVTFIMIPFLFLSIPLRDTLIRLFYTKEFIEAGLYLPWHFIGLLFYMYWSIFSMVLTPTGRIKVHGVFVTIMSLTNILVVYFLVPRLGLYGWMLKFIISPVIFTIVYYIYLKAEIGINISKKNSSLMVYLILISLSLIVIDKYALKYLVSFLFTALAILFLSKQERQYIIGKVNYSINSILNKK